MIPLGCPRRLRMMGSCFLLRSRRSKPNCCSFRLRRRRLIDSPFTVGIVETRNSIPPLFAVQPIETKLLLVSAEETQTDRFAIHGRNRRDSNIDLLIIRV